VWKLNMHKPPEDIVQYKRDRKLYKEHLDRVHTMGHMIDTGTPESLGLKHLQTRAKKKQLIEDRQQTIAKQNKHLMEKMTTIMAEDRRQPKHFRHPSLNERERKNYVEKVNRDNDEMMKRLNKAKPMIRSKKFEEDFELHKKISGYLKKKRYGPASLKQNTKLPSATKKPTSTFDADAYMSMFGGGHDSLFESGEFGGTPISSMAEFRKQVISTKRMNSSSSTLSPSPVRGNQLPKQCLDKTQTSSTAKKEIRFEMAHEPTL